jgi:hypothetical protein
MATPDAPFEILAQVDFSVREMASPGNPGKDIKRAAAIVIDKGDIARSTRPDWVPKANDAITVTEGDRLYISHVRGSNPIPARMGSSGGYTAYLISVTDRQPANAI